MVCKQFLVKRAQRRRYCRHLRDNIRAIGAVFNHIANTAYLPLYAAEPIDKIAGNLGLSRSMINKELANIRLALKERLESEGYII